MWFRAQLLPIIISEKIPVDDEHWQNFLNLILDSVFASVTSLDSAAFLLPTMSRFAGPGGYILQDLSHYMIHTSECWF